MLIAVPAWRTIRLSSTTGDTAKPLTPATTCPVCAHAPLLKKHHHVEPTSTHQVLDTLVVAAESDPSSSAVLQQHLARHDGYPTSVFAHPTHAPEAIGAIHTRLVQDGVLKTTPSAKHVLLLPAAPAGQHAQSAAVPHVHTSAAAPARRHHQRRRARRVPTLQRHAAASHVPRRRARHDHEDTESEDDFSRVYTTTAASLRIDTAVANLRSTQLTILQHTYVV